MKPWKRAEYYIAQICGGRRVPLSGGPGAHCRYDVGAGPFAIEVTTDVKRWKEKWRRVCDVAHMEKKIPILFMRLEGNWVAVIPGPLAGKLIRGRVSHVAQDEP
jgi:hypothetical protein